MSDEPFSDDPIDEAWWEAVLSDARSRVRPEDLEDGFIDDDFGDWTSARSAE